MEVINSDNSKLVNETQTTDLEDMMAVTQNLNEDFLNKSWSKMAKMKNDEYLFETYED